MDISTWARGRIGDVKRTTSKSKNLVKNFEELKVSLLEVSTTVIMEENWIKTGLNLIPFMLLDHGAEGSQGC